MIEALGVVEVKGMSAALNVADMMCKAADVALVGIRKTKGGGWMTIIVKGNVGAVKAAVATGVKTAQQMNLFIAETVIARSATDLLDTLDLSETTKIFTQFNKKTQLQIETICENNDTIEPSPIHSDSIDDA